MCHGFQITYFNIQQLSIVLIMALLEHFNLEVNEKDSFRSNDSKLGMLFLTNNYIVYKHHVFAHNT